MVKLKLVATAVGIVGVFAATEPGHAQQELPLVRLVEEMRIVSNDSSIGTSLTSIAADGSVILRDGRLLTLHMAEARIRVFDQNGRFQAMVGGRGDGPGELRSPRRVNYVGDTIWVHEMTRRRYEFFSWDLKPIASLVAPGRGGFYYGVAPGGLILFDDTRDSLPLGLYDGRGNRVRGLDIDMPNKSHEFQISVRALLPSGERGDATTPRTTRSPFGRSTSITLAPGGREMIVLQPSEIVGGAPGQFTIQRLDIVTGRMHPPVTIALPPRRVTAAIADSSIARIVRSFPDAEAEYRSKMRLPEFLPPYGYWNVHQDGVLLLRQAGDDSTQVMVTTDGAMRQRVLIPAGLVVMDANRTHVWGYMRDADDLPIVLRYRISR